MDNIHWPESKVMRTNTAIYNSAAYHVAIGVCERNAGCSTLLTLVALRCPRMTLPALSTLAHQFFVDVDYAAMRFARMRVNRARREKVAPWGKCC